MAVVCMGIRVRVETTIMEVGVRRVDVYVEHEDVTELRRSMMLQTFLFSASFLSWHEGSLPT